MKRLLNIIRLDFHTLKQFRIFLLAGTSVSIALYINWQSAMIGLQLMMMVLLASHPFQIAEINHLDVLYATLPLTRRDVVRGRYAYALTGISLASILTLICAPLISRILMLEGITAELIPAIVTGFSSFCIITALQYPFYFRFSFMKARVLSVLALVTACLLLIPWMDGIILAVNANPVLTAVVAIVGGLVLMCVSCEISSRIYTKRNL